MRLGYNPNKDQELEQSDYDHQIIVPVHIPHLEDYFKDAQKILEISLQSIKNTTHKRSYISVVNNGSCKEIAIFLDALKRDHIVHEVIHTVAIGKLNAILKGIIGQNFPLITITDADIIFKPGWQQETVDIFNSFPKCGMVGLIPQFNMFSTFCSSLLFDTFFNKKAEFIKVKEPEEMRKFYQSLGWKMQENHNYLQYALAITGEDGATAYFGSSHVVATYRAEIFAELPKNFNFKMGGNTESYFDRLPQEMDLWKLTTLQNFAYHLGNSWEAWMESPPVQNVQTSSLNNFILPKKNVFKNLVKNEIFKRLLLKSFLNNLFFRIKGLPSKISKEYDKIYY